MQIIEADALVIWNGLFRTSYWWLFLVLFLQGLFFVLFFFVYVENFDHESGPCWILIFVLASHPIISCLETEKKRVKVVDLVGPNYICLEFCCLDFPWIKLFFYPSSWTEFFHFWWTLLFFFFCLTGHWDFEFASETELDIETLNSKLKSWT